MDRDRRSAVPFARVPEILLDAVSDRAVRLYAMLDRYAGTDARAYPRRSVVAERLACSLSSLDRAMGELVEAGAVEIVSGRLAGKANHYLLTGRYVTHDVPRYVTGDVQVRHPRRTGYVTHDVQKESQEKESQEEQGGTSPMTYPLGDEVAAAARSLVNREAHEVDGVLAALADEHGATAVVAALDTLAGRRFTFASDLRKAIVQAVPRPAAWTSCGNGCDDNGLVLRSDGFAERCSCHPLEQAAPSRNGTPSPAAESATPSPRETARAVAS